MFSRGFSIAMVAALQIIMPPIVVVGTLVLLCRFYDVDYDNFFVALSIIVSILTLTLPHGRANGNSQLISAPRSLALHVVVRWMIICAILLALGYVTKYSEDFSRRVVVTWVFVTPALLIPVALVLHELMRRVVHNRTSARRVAFAGCTEASIALAERIENNSEALGFHVLGFFDDRSASRLGLSGRIRRLGSLTDLVDQARSGQVDVVFVALPLRHVCRVMELMDQLRDTTASIYYVPDIFVSDLIQARTGEILGMPVVALCETPFYGYRGVVKRITDVVFTCVILAVAAPVMLAIALMIRYSKYSSPGPIVFKQRRYGFDGREIVVYKFRTMTVSEDGPSVQQATRDDARVTPLGRFLRRYSLDELPQLFNVLQGQMSLVGPRPHAVAHNEEYRRLIKGYMIRHKAPPGITGLAQVNGCRGETSRIEEMQARIDYDLEYLRRWTPLLDLKILILTAIRVIHDEKAY